MAIASRSSPLYPLGNTFFLSFSSADGVFFLYPRRGIPFARPLFSPTVLASFSLSGSVGMTDHSFLPPPLEGAISAGLPLPISPFFWALRVGGMAFFSAFPSVALVQLFAFSEAMTRQTGEVDPPPFFWTHLASFPFFFEGISFSLRRFYHPFLFRAGDVSSLPITYRDSGPDFFSLLPEEAFLFLNFFVFTIDSPSFPQVSRPSFFPLSSDLGDFSFFSERLDG